MRAWCWTLLAGAAAVPFSCGSPGAGQPVTAEATSAAAPASFDPASLFSPPSASASAAAAAESAPASPFHLVLTSPYPALDVRAWPGGALIVTHGLIVAVKGAETLQRAEWLSGLPEIVNWDAEVKIELPAGGRIDSTLPAGALLSVSAGNRHGPHEMRLWEGRTWSTRQSGGDPRIVAVYRDFNRFPISQLRLPGGRDLVLRPGEKGGYESLLFEPGAEPARISPVPAKGNDSYFAWLIGPSESVRLCLPDGEIFAWQGDKWTAERGHESGKIRGCAATASGTVWVVGDNGTVDKRVADGWEKVPLPPRVQASGIWAGGERVWITAGEQVLSTEPVGRQVRVGQSQLPGEVYYGISGLDATGPALLNVSRDPAGPGTPACDSLLIVLGAALSAAQRSSLSTDPAAASLDLFEAQGSEAGVLSVMPGRGAQMKLRPSSRVRKVAYLVPPSFDDGVRMVELLRKGAEEPKPALLCAVARNPRNLGKVFR